MKTLIGIKRKLVALLLVLGLSVGAGVAGNGAWLGQPPPRVDDKQPPVVQGDPPKKDVTPLTLDQYGDPLPASAVARLGTVRWRHAGLTTFAAFLPDGKAVLSAGADNTIRIWEYPSGKELRRVGPVNVTADWGPNFLVALSP